ncbi:MAG: DUF6624 domain-containing protein [Thermoanaerobaculia bacterium]|jgi:hypothetical protein
MQKRVAIAVILILGMLIACRTAPAPDTSVPAAPVPVAPPPPPPPVATSTAWIPADPAKLCADAPLFDLCAELLELRNRDQLIRRKWLADRENPAVQAEVDEVDRANLVEIERIIAKHGYPGRSLVGAKAAGSAWTIIQHADLATQKKYLDVMTKAVDSGDLEGALLATTVDRIRIREGKPQVYGSQFHEVDGGMVPQPIEDPEHVDERRAKVGLQPLAEYAALMNEMYKKRQ